MFTLVSYMFSLHNKPTIGVFTKVLIIRMGPTGSHPGIGTEGRGHQEPEKTGLDIQKKGGLHHQIYKISLCLLWISSRSHSVDEVEFLPPVDVPPLKGVLHVPTGAGFLSWTIFHRPGFLWSKGHFPHFKTISEWVVVCFVATSHPDLCGDSWECFGPLEIQTM